MNDSNKKTGLRFSTIILVAAIGVIAAAFLYQAQTRGLLPKTVLEAPKLPSQETRTVVQEENAVISVVDKSSPSVVAIGVTQRVINRFDPFSAPQSQSSTIGTGFVVSDKGIIVTNKHVVSESGSYSVITKDGQKFDVKRIYRDPTLDMAIVQIDGSNLKPLELGDSSKLKVGQTVIAIGNALGRFTNTVTTGVVSGLGRSVVAGDPFGGSQESLDNLIQTDAAVNPGNSGGPLLNSAGQVVGVNVATTDQAQNISFAIPINAVKSIVDEFVTKGTVSRPYMGIRYEYLDRDQAILYRVAPGAYIHEVIQGGPASKAGVQEGDIITKIKGQDVNSDNTISDAIKDAKIGQSLDLEIWRNGQTQKVSVTLEELPSE